MLNRWAERNGLKEPLAKLGVNAKMIKAFRLMGRSLLLVIEHHGWKLYLKASCRQQHIQRKTSQVPSYWYGWSPDGCTLAYVGRRSRPFSIFTCSIDGVEESFVTTDYDHGDGPD